MIEELKYKGLEMIVTQHHSFQDLQLVISITCLSNISIKIKITASRRG